MDLTSVLLQRDEFSYINHLDHRAVGEASLYAVFPSAETFRVMRFGERVIAPRV